MSIQQWIVTIIEILGVIALIIGLLYEPVIAVWERRQGEKMLKEFKERQKFRK